MTFCWCWLFVRKIWVRISVLCFNFNLHIFTCIENNNGTHGSLVLWVGCLSFLLCSTFWFYDRRECLSECTWHHDTVHMRLSFENKAVVYVKSACVSATINSFPRPTLAGKTWLIGTRGWMLHSSWIRRRSSANSAPQQTHQVFIHNELHSSFQRGILSNHKNPYVPKSPLRNVLNVALKTISVFIWPTEA